MFVRLYKRPELVGWLGWIEDDRQNAMGYIRPDGSIRWMAGVQNG